MGPMESNISEIWNLNIKRVSYNKSVCISLAIYSCLNVSIAQYII